MLNRRDAERSAFEQVAAEVARGEFVTWVMAKAAADAGGDEARAKSLYMRYRADELLADGRKAALQEQGRALAAIAAKPVAKAKELWHAISLPQATKQYNCKGCGAVTNGTRVARGDELVALGLLLLGIIPGVIYIAARHGYKLVCDKCNGNLDAGPV